jgi:hypothetical protein
MDSDNIYDKIMQMFGKIPDNFSILEDQIDIKVQMNFFESSKKIKQNPDSKKTIAEIKEGLLDKNLGIEDQKDLLVQLANYDDVEAYRILEKYFESVVPELRDWCALALQESKMNLESALLDENQVIISTGLGGKGKKLRYFAVLATKNENKFTSLQKRLVEKEIDFALKKKDGEIENIEFDDTFCTFLTIVPINISIKDLIAETIEECNQIGNFIDPKFILTNVKVFSKEEIKASWKDVKE